MPKEKCIYYVIEMEACALNLGECEFENCEHCPSAKSEVEKHGTE